MVTKKKHQRVKRVVQSPADRIGDLDSAQPKPISSFKVESSFGKRISHLASIGRISSQEAENLQNMIPDIEGESTTEKRNSLIDDLNIGVLAALGRGQPRPHRSTAVSSGVMWTRGWPIQDKKSFYDTIEQEKTAGVNVLRLLSGLVLDSDSNKLPMLFIQNASLGFVYPPVEALPKDILTKIGITTPKLDDYRELTGGSLLEPPAGPGRDLAWIMGKYPGTRAFFHVVTVPSSEDPHPKTMERARWMTNPLVEKIPTQVLIVEHNILSTGAHSFVRYEDILRESNNPVDVKKLWLTDPENACNQLVGFQKSARGIPVYLVNANPDAMDIEKKPNVRASLLDDCHELLIPIPETTPHMLKYDGSIQLPAEFFHRKLAEAVAESFRKTPEYGRLYTD